MRVVKLNDNTIAEVSGEGTETVVTLFQKVGSMPVNTALFQALIPCFVKPREPENNVGVAGSHPSGEEKE